MGIWPPDADGTDVNALDAAPDKGLVILLMDDRWIHMISHMYYHYYASGGDGRRQRPREPVQLPLHCQERARAMLRRPQLTRHDSSLPVAAVVGLCERQIEQ